MTPAQLTAIAVAFDGLREAGVDEATLARMQRAVDGRIEAAVVRFMTAHDDHNSAVEYSTAAAELREVACLIAYPHLPGVSPAESRGGASAPQPEAET